MTSPNNETGIMIRLLFENRVCPPTSRIGHSAAGRGEARRIAWPKIALWPAIPAPSSKSNQGGGDGGPSALFHRSLLVPQLQPSPAAYPVKPHGQEQIDDLVADQQPAEHRQGHRGQNLAADAFGKDHWKDRDDRH